MLLTPATLTRMGDVLDTRNITQMLLTPATLHIYCWHQQHYTDVTDTSNITHKLLTPATLHTCCWHQQHYTDVADTVNITNMLLTPAILRRCCWRQRLWPEWVIYWTPATLHIYCWHQQHYTGVTDTSNITQVLLTPATLHGCYLHQHHPPGGHAVFVKELHELLGFVEKRQVTARARETETLGHELASPLVFWAQSTTRDYIEGWRRLSRRDLVERTK